MIEVKVLGVGCANCKATHKLIEKVASDNAISINLKKIEDTAEIMSYGIMSTPGVIVDGKIAHAGGIPDKVTVLSWFKSQCCPTDNDCC
ncbi:Thiol-disulfide isomerase and thioredoxins [Bathymodiolus thermophilus thioautotrophic gill symbiont]|uniref:thioredoxin family protein n=1 Tax=Bathymodiolus thermophilus thioautotrophic gill symbiont TaxID=2360 RepID=UPI0010B7E61C|nr:thioredoxin family protein [Bathymodiolus thermophilus thioautotrophic gill symbiont]CAB5502554.1 hypothetical protein THERMOT_1639 [Bathymodiolus thermophilus thioautotrophic gill symbiont]SGZ98465.1 Thiol-disulfide isomerase and thioredoxins [Bathymodiolus thermophilus thioautotrophic gill symbiont]